jgi:hypothetical protein
MGPLYKAYIRKKLGNGGQFDEWIDMQEQTSKSGQIGAGAVDTGINFGSIGLQGVAYKDDQKYQPDGAFRTIQGAKGMSTGWRIGNQALGPIGGMAGALIGGGIGIYQGNKMDKEEKERKGQDDALYRNMVNQEMQMNAYMNRDYFNDTRGNQMYATGGQFTSPFMGGQPTPGGSLSQLSKNSMEVHGQTHEEGGVQIPSQGAEVEKGETIAGDFVFSEELGFAKLHKPIAKAKGKIEQKPATAERITSLKLLHEKEEGLKLSQEFFKRQLNIQ